MVLDYARSPTAVSLIFSFSKFKEVAGSDQKVYGCVADEVKVTLNGEP